jgi:hypothetical protein
MGYKLLGFVVWQGGRIYARRRLRGAGHKLAVAAITAAVLGGVVAAGKSASGNDT